MATIDVSPSADERVQLIAARYNVDVGHIRLVCREWRELDGKGTPIQITVRGLSQMTMHSAWDNYGIAEDDVRAERMSTGLADLFPKAIIKNMRSLEGRYRYWLNKMSFKVGVYAPFRYMLDKTYSAWERKKAELDDAWNEAVAELTNQHAYDQALARLVADYTRIADASYTAKHATATARGIVLEETYDNFLQRMVDRATAAFPTRERLLETVKVEVTLGLLLNPFEIEKQLLETPNVASNGHAQIHQMQLAHLRRQFSGMVSPRAEVVDGFYANLHREAAAILRVLYEHGSIPARTTNRIFALRDDYQLYSLSANEQVEAALDAIGRAMVKLDRPIIDASGKKLKYDMPAVIGSLRSLLHATRDSAQRMAEIAPDEWQGAED